MITKDNLQEVNQGLKSIPVKKKNYVMVNERIKAFRQICPEGSIVTDIVSHTDTPKGRVVVMKTTICNEVGQVLATGYAYEEEKSSYINKTSYIENCETSSVGRALGMCGIGIEDNIASAEELVNAITNQTDQKSHKWTAPKDQKATQQDNLQTTQQVAEPVGKTNRERLIIFCRKNGYDLNEVKDRFGITELTNEVRYGALLNQLMDEVQAKKLEEAANGQ